MTLTFGGGVVYDEPYLGDYTPGGLNLSEINGSYQNALSPVVGNMSGGNSFGSGSDFGGTSGAPSPIHGYANAPSNSVGGTSFVSFGGYTPPTTTVPISQPSYVPPPPSIQQNYTAPSPMNFPQVPNAPSAASPTPAASFAPAQPLAPLPTASAPGGAGGSGVGGNPYANPSYTAPLNPLAMATIGAQAQGAPGQSPQGQASLTGGGGSPLGVTGGLHGGVSMNVPQNLAPSAPPPVPFGNMGNRLAATAGPANVSAQSRNRPTVGQELKVPPAPNGAGLLPPPPAYTPNAGQLGPISAGAAQQMQPDVPKKTPLELALGQLLNNALEGMYGNHVALTKATDKAYGELKDKIAEIQEKITAPARAQVEVFTKPTLNLATRQMDGPSALEQAHGAQMQANAASAQASHYLSKANEAYNHIADLMNGVHDDYFQKQGRMIYGIARNANKSTPEIPDYIQNIRKSDVELVPGTVVANLKNQAIRRYEGFMKLASDQAKENDAHAQSLQGRVDAINKQYNDALGEKVKAFDRAAMIGKDMRDTFWKEYDEKVKDNAQINSDQMTALKIYEANIMAQDNNEWRKMDMTLKQRANEINEGKAGNDAQDKAARLLREIVSQKAAALAAAVKSKKPDLIEKAQDDYDAWNAKQKAGGL